MCIDLIDSNIQIAIISTTGTLVGVIIGGVLTAISTILTDYLKFNRDEKNYKIRKKEETYIELIKLLGSYEIYGEHETNINRELMLGTLAKTRIYNSTKVQNILAEIVDNDNYWENNKLTISNDAVKNAITNMIKIMRSELKIEDK